MSATVSDMEPRVLARLEEPSPPIFWDLAEEVRVLAVEAMMEGALITGEPEVRGSAQAVIQNQAKQAMPLGSVALLRVEGPDGQPVRKVTIWDLDQAKPTWENDTDVSLYGATGRVRYWFPIGLTNWGIYPKQTTAVNVTLSFLALPTLDPAAATVYPLPYTGAEVVPFQLEYLEAFEEYAAHAARLKEASTEFFAGIQEYDRFIAKMAELNRFGDRIGSLRFSRSRGMQSSPAPREIV